MPGCFRARVPRQVCIAEDQREAGAGLGTGTGSSGRPPSQGWEHPEQAGLLSGWGFLVVRCAFGKPPTLMAKIAAHQYSGQGLDLPPQFQLIFITILPVGIILRFTRQSCQKPYLQEVTPWGPNWGWCLSSTLPPWPDQSSEFYLEALLMSSLSACQVVSVVEDS